MTSKKSKKEVHREGLERWPVTCQIESTHALEMRADFDSRGYLKCMKKTMTDYSDVDDKAKGLDDHGETILYEEHPSMFRNQPVWFVITCILCLVVVGLFIFASWYLKCKGTTLTVTNDRTTCRRGILSKSITEVWHQDIRNVQLDQTFFQRIFDVGTIGISSAGQADLEIKVSGIPQPERVKDLIDAHRRRDRS